MHDPFLNITWIKYAESQKIWQSNNLKIFGSMKTTCYKQNSLNMIWFWFDFWCFNAIFSNIMATQKKTNIKCNVIKSTIYIQGELD